MGEFRQMGVPFQIDEYDRYLIFNLIVQDLCIDKFGKMDDIFQAVSNRDAMIWLAVEMFNQDVEIWNKRHQDNKKPLVTGKDVKQGIDGYGGYIELNKAINAAIIKGLPREAIEEVEEIGKNLIAAQNGMTTMNRQQRRSLKKA